VKELFARIASRYDLINDLQSFGLHRYWKRRLIKLAGPQPGARALDLCCGTGDLAFALARAGADVTGLDFSREMLEVAMNKAKVLNRAATPHSPLPAPHSPLRTPRSDAPDFAPERGCVRSTSRSTPQPATAESVPPPALAAPSAVPIPHSTLPTRHSAFPTPHSAIPTPHFFHGDAERTPFPDNSFDIVTVGYGLRNLADWEAGLREMVRVAKPGGSLLVLDFGKPDNALWRGLYFGYLRFFVPVLGRIFCGSASAYSYILESLKHYPAQHGVAAKMQELQLAEVRIMTFLGGIMTINYARKRSGVW
jgi:ubiquinone/menaquinone biosynthesis C-methylase UbiE